MRNVLSPLHMHDQMFQVFVFLCLHSGCVPYESWRNKQTVLHIASQQPSVRCLAIALAQEQLGLAMHHCLCAERTTRRTCAC
jgi:hypothetical protein